MINKDNLKGILKALHFDEVAGIFVKYFAENDAYLKVDFNKNSLIYPTDKGFIVNGDFTTNFSSPENFVVFECVHRLLEKGYKPESIELEPKWKLGHGASGGRADIFVRNQEGKPLLIIECKTFGKEFNKEWKDMQLDGGQLFSYIEQEKDVEFVCLYASSFDDKEKNILNEQRIISHKDNDQILADDTKRKGFRDAKNVKERFRIWKETYMLEFTEKGIFEENIQAYQIGKNKYTLAIDTKIIDASDKKGKYHQFRTILRKHNVSRRENAFEVLVNLFLCKIVDEKENQHDLKFYWKGIAYDNYFDLIDRLQELYKIGMERFLGQDITYISNQKIDDIFWAFKQKRNATKKEIKEIFRTLKFFNDNYFGFISVRNQETFDKNAKILLEIIQMWQGLRLKTKEQNQFLGDMFEFFLDNGIKQSEGQFFTPVPICKFIVMSLPLESKIIAKSEPLRAMDYACGSGHFLTEYALQVKPLVKKLKDTEPNEYYKNTFGIEKEDRLAKVAKVSAFMYGLDEIQIFDADALKPNEKIKDETVDVLVANPPFAVEDFLLTLEEDEREKFDLLQSVADMGNKNIQCFFLERAKQLLAPNGVAGIVVPTSVLSNSDTMHIQTREILLKYFDFISIVELGSGTFGKTGTNTVVLFLRRKAQRPEPAEHYWNRTLDFFDNWEQEIKSGGGAYLDIDVVKRYCQHINIPFEDYQTLLAPSPSGRVGEGLMNYEVFKDYHNDFENINDIKKLREAKPFKAKTAQAQETELNKRFLNYVQEIEKQKLYYFMLADSQTNKVLLVKSPQDNKEQKTFLGYEWSGAKGNEGIKYNGGETVYDINTPMFDPNDAQNPEKINYWIQQNFNADTNVETLHATSAMPNIELHDSDKKTLHDELHDSNKKTLHATSLQSCCTYTNLADLLDFSQKAFNKNLNLNPKKNTQVAIIESKWELVKLGDECELITKGTTPTSIGFQFVNQGINFVKIESISQTGQIDKAKFAYITKECNEKLGRSKLAKNDILFSIAGALGRTAIVSDDILPANTNQALALIRLNVNARFSTKYLYLVLSSDLIQSQIERLKVGIAQSNLSLTQINEFKIPLPPLDVQQQIVDDVAELENNKNQFLVDGISIKDFEKLVKDKKNEIIKKYL